jgi:polyphenol oxidase
VTGTPTTTEAPAPRGIPALELPEWRERYGIVAGITTRADDFNLGLLTDAPAAQVLGRWRVFAAAMRPGFRTMAVGLQVHGSTVAVHDAPSEGLVVLDGVDGHATGRAGVLLCVTVGDCVPVYLVHPGSGAIALLHAGWRGVAAGILDTGLQALIRLTGARARDVVMHCGTAICGDCYEVGPEVLAAVSGRRAGGPGRLDLRDVLAARAREAGIRHLTVSSLCSVHDADRFYSHRRSGGLDGRMAGYLGRPVD